MVDPDHALVSAVLWTDLSGTADARVNEGEEHPMRWNTAEETVTLKVLEMRWQAKDGSGSGDLLLFRRHRVDRGWTFGEWTEIIGYSRVPCRCTAKGDLTRSPR